MFRYEVKHLVTLSYPHVSVLWRCSCKKTVCDNLKTGVIKHLNEIINPDIIVCGHTFDMLKQVLGDELDVENTCDTLYGFWKDKLIINYYHPACRYPNRMHYYALMSICKVTEKEWKDRIEGLNIKNRK